MATIKDIEALTQRYADATAELKATIAALEHEVEQVRRKYVKGLTKLADKWRGRRAELHGAIEGAPELFVKPRSFTFWGVRVGFQKGKGKVAYDDADKVVALIERHLADQAELLVIIAKKPNKEAILQLTAADVKRIGCCITGTEDEVMIKDAASDIDKWLAGLLKDDEALEA